MRSNKLATADVYALLIKGTGMCWCERVVRERELREQRTN